MKISLGFFVLLVCYMIFCQCCMRMRWNDTKAYAVFKKRNTPLKIFDTVIDKHHLHYAVTGSDQLPTLVFVHGSPGSWFHYMYFMQDSALQQKFRIVSIDRPGFGYSDFGNAMHLDEQCPLISQVLKSIRNTKPMYLCGHSMGGPVVAKLAADDPGMYKKIVIVAGALDAAQEKKELWRYIMKDPPLYWALPGAFGPSNTELLYLKKDLIPLADDLEKITAEVIFVHGDEDTWVPIENFAYGMSKMTHAKSLHADTLKGADTRFPGNEKRSSGIYY